VSIYAFFVLLAAQVTTGLFSVNLEEFAGPLNILVSGATARLLTAYHKDIGEPALLALTLLHVSAIAYYHLRRGQNLIGPMLHGDKKLAGAVTASRDDWRSRCLAIVVLIIAAGAIAGLISFGGE
jgi:cytochrome b